MTDQVVRNSVGVADPDAPQNVLRPGADGGIKISTASVGGSSTTPLYVTNAGSSTGTTSLWTYNSPAPTVANGATVPAQSDNRGNLEVTLGTAIAGEDIPNNVLASVRRYLIGTTYSRTVFSGIAVLSGVAKATAGQLVSLFASNISTGLVYVQVFNSATAPAAGATPIYSFPLGAGTATVAATLIIDDTFFGPNGINLATGISYGISTTAATYTAAATATNFTVSGTVI